MGTVLESLKDIAGVAGSFAMDSDGEVFANAMPAYVQTEDLGRIAPRLQWVIEAASELQVEQEWCTLYFESYHLQVALFAGGSLVVLTEPEVNGRALRMAAKILCRKLERIVDGTASSRNTLPPPVVEKPPQAFSGGGAFEVRAQGRLSEQIAEPGETTNARELRNTQPSMATPSVAKTSGPPSDPASPEARSSRRPASPRSMVYRGRRYDVSG